LQALQEKRFGLPRLEFGFWVMIGANDQAYESIASIQDTARQYLQLEVVFIEEAREFREDSRFEKLSKDIGWKEYWKMYGGPDLD